MAAQTFFSWLKAAKISRRVARNRQATRRFVPRVETLEAREVPATFVVDTFADSVDINPGDGICADALGKCSLRAAIQEANALAGDDTIVLPAGTYNLTLTGAGEETAATGDLDVAANGKLTIRGDGAATTIIDAASLGDRVFHVLESANLDISEVSIRNGTQPFFAGGGMYNVGTVRLTDCTLSGNGAGKEGGAIYTDGAMEVSHCTLSDNFAFGGGGGIYNAGKLTVNKSLLGWENRGHFFGGGIYNAGTLTVSESTLMDNRAGSGGGIYNTGTLTVSDSTFSENSAASDPAFPGSGGGIYNSGTLTVSQSTLSDNIGWHGGGIFSNGTLTVTNSTVSGNLAPSDGGGIANDGTLTVTNSTFSNNSAYDGGGIESGGTMELNNCIVANSTSGGDVANHGTLSGSHNLIEDGSGGLADTITGDPLLGPLADNGGPTQTMAINFTSPAINAGSNSFVDVSEVQQVTVAGTAGAFRLTFAGQPTTPLAFNATTASEQTALNALSSIGGVGGSVSVTGTPSNYTVTFGGSLANQDLAQMTATPSGGASSTVTTITNGAPLVTTDQRGFARIKGGTVDIGAFEVQNQAPTDITLSHASVAENQPAGTVVGTLSTTDPDVGDTFTYALVSGTGDADNGSFTINPDGTLKTAASFDYEAKSSYSIRVKSTDAGGLSYEKAFTISVTDINEAPTLTLPGAQTVYEDVDKAIAGIKVGDPEGDHLSVTLSVGHGKLTLNSGGQIITGSSVTLSGSIHDLNTALAGLDYRGLLNFGGDDALCITVSDGSLSTSGSVAIHVKSWAEQTVDLTGLVDQFVAQGVLNQGQGNALKLNLKDNNGDIGKVQAFLNQVKDFLQTGILTQTQADSLLDPGNILLLSVSRR